MVENFFLEDSETKIEAEPIDAGVLRILIKKDKDLEVEDRGIVRAEKIRSEDIERGEWSLEGSPENFSIVRGNSKLANFKDLQFSLPEWSEPEEERFDEWVSVKQEVKTESRIYGLGEKTGHLEKSDARYEMWNKDPGGFYTPKEDPIYMSIPFYILVASSEGSPKEFLGVYLDQTQKSKFDIKYKSGAENIGIAANSEYLLLYLILGDSVRGVVEKYTDLTGKPLFPPLWALGNQQCKWGKPKNEEEAYELAKEFRSRDIPCDVLYFDIQYMDNYKIFTWDRECFPDPEEMVKNLHDMDYKVVTIIDPGVKVEKGYEVFESGLENDVFLKDEEGEPFEGTLWPGLCGYPDFLRKNVREWWRDLHEDFLGYGIDGIWDDMNEPVIWFGKKEIKEIVNDLMEKVEKNEFHLSDLVEINELSGRTPEGIVHENDEGDKVSHEKVHNAYAFYETMSTYDAFDKFAPDKRPFVMSRSGFAGIQKYATTWTGDNSSNWDHMGLSIPIILNSGLSGLPFTGADIGGFHGEIEPELLTRWIQLGVFLPFYRNHSAVGTVDQEPWAFGEKFEKINRKYIKLRYKLLPYLYTLTHRAHEKGTPIARPLFMEFPDDEETYLIQDEFMLGSSILVAPVLEKSENKRHVYLPYENGEKIEWENWWSGEILESGHHLVDSPLDTLPLFLREDRGIPMTTSTHSTEEMPDKLILRGNLKDKITIPIYYDDGKSEKYKEGEYFYGEFIIQRDGEKAEISLNVENDGYEPFWEEIEIQLEREGKK